MGLAARLRRLFSRPRSGSIRSAGQIRDHRGGYQSMLDREATVTDLDELRGFVATRAGVEFYLEPETTATDTTVAAVALDGEWIRRRVGSAKVAVRLAKELGVPLYDAGVLGYPDAMRRYRRR